MKKEKNQFYKFNDLPKNEYLILIGERGNGKSHIEAESMLKWLKSVLMICSYNGNLILDIKPPYDKDACMDVIREWLVE